MSRALYDEACKGCKPALFDPATGAVYPDEHPIMRAVLAAWATVSPADRHAWHAFTCKNARDALTMEAVARISATFRDAIAKAAPEILS